MRVDTLIAGGTVATGSGSAECDVAIKDGRIVGLTDPRLRPDADRYVDATGKADHGPTSRLAGGRPVRTLRRG